MPPNVWSNPETKPVIPTPAIGILNVWEFPVDEILKLLPLNPAYKNWAEAPSPFIWVIPIPIFVGASTPPK